MNNKIAAVLACAVAPFLMASVAFADPSVDLQILNATGANGEIIVVAGEDVEVGFDVTLDSGSVLDKKDKLELVDLADDMAVSSKQRGNSATGSVVLSVPNNVLVFPDGLNPSASYPNAVLKLPVVVCGSAKSPPAVFSVAKDSTPGGP